MQAALDLGLVISLGTYHHFLPNIIVTSSAKISAISLAIICLSTLLQTACGRSVLSRPSVQKKGFAQRQEFVDLQPGWKLQVVVPILRSGGYVVPSVKRADPKNLDIETGDEFLGYEKDYYKIVSRNDGVAIQFSRAEVWENRKTSTRQNPRLRLFAEAANANHVRLVYLIRASQADHDMAIVASDDLAALDELTRAVTQNAECKHSQKATCKWVPEGIAVTPLKQ